MTRTPATLDALLRGLPSVWTDATEGPNTWSPYIVMGHLIHGERGDWIQRLSIILEHGVSRTFETFDREAQFKESAAKPLAELLDEFAALRQGNLAQLRALDLQSAQLELQGLHPAFGPRHRATAAGHVDGARFGAYAADHARDGPAL
ncbi:MAG: DinB family protein [Acidobacteriota bacterium]